MNKKVLSAILFSALFAGTGTFTSCIDNDEPAGIEELRGAKAELLRAKVAVEQAQAALIMAKAETEKALAAKENAEAEINKAIAAINQAKADSINLKTEQERENLKQLIAKHELELDSLQLKHQLIMTNLKTQLAESQQTYESTLAQIAVVKEMYPLGTKAGWTLYSLQEAVDDWTEKVEYADSIVKERQADYDTALIYKQYYGEIETSELEAKADTAEIKLAAAKAELAEMEAWLEEDALTKDWRAEVDKLNTKLDSLNKLQASLNAQKILAENSEEYKALVKAETEAAKTANVDSAYSYTYIDVDATAKALKETTYRLYGVKDAVTGQVNSTVFDANFATTTNADSLAAKAELAAINLIAKYDANGNLLQDNKLYNDKKYLASFTTEVKAFLDTIAATAVADTSLKAKSDAAIKAWKDTLALYSAVDTTMAVKYDSAISKRNAWNAMAVKSPKTIDDYRKALLDYLTVAVKNGAVLNTTGILVPQDSVWVANGNSATKDLSYALEAPLALLADTTKTYYAIETLKVDFLTAKTETGKRTEVDKATSKDKEFTYDKYAVKTAALDATTLLAALKRSSNAAFGKAENYVKNLPTYGADFVNKQGDYLHTQPSEVDVRALYDYFNIKDISGGALGAYGKYLYAQDDAVEVFAKNYQAIIANLEGAIAYWEAAYKTLKAKYDAQQDAYKAATLAKNKYYYTNIDIVATKTNEIDQEISEIGLITGALDNLINVYLPAWENKAQLGDYSAANDAFKKNLNNIIALKQASVRSLERALALAKVNLELSKTEYCSKLTIAESNLNKAIEDLKDAQAELDKALADAAKALEIIAALDAE